jgi:glutamyl-tRNA synthetase
VNFQEEDPIDPKAAWLNAETIRSLPVEELAEKITPFLQAAGYDAEPAKVLAVTPLIRERIKLLRDAAAVGDFFFVEELGPYDPAELIPQKGDAAMAKTVLQKAREVLAKAEFTHDALEAAMRGAAAELGLKTGQTFLPVRVAVCGRKTAPPLFETLHVLGRDAVLKRVGQAIEKL